LDVLGDPVSTPAEPTRPALSGNSDLAPAGVPQGVSWALVAAVGGGALVVGVLIVLAVFFTR
ncbi:MAG TPA: hypothetical protein VGP93_01020, partial [Polyangiaceae bacterium]|nr:hypothetical protein [Polyangiaceae bacterium]